jgi:hypothetical protein
MAITAKARQAAVDALPRDYDANADAGIPQACSPKVRLRLVADNKKTYWHDKGLRPVKKGSGLVLNDEHMETRADGTLRYGSLEVWAEHVENNTKRRAELRAKADEQEAALHALAGSKAGAAVEPHGENFIEHAGFRAGVGVEDEPKMPDELDLGGQGTAPDDNPFSA